MPKQALAPSSKEHVVSNHQIRASFPALERQHLGQPVAYFDGPGGTQVPRPVVEAMKDYLYHHNANTHWRFPTSAETDALIAGSRETLADFLGAAPTEIAFGANMTTLTFHLARALGRRWGPGDTVVVTELDHHANVAPWRAVERERGITVASVPMQAGTGQLDWGRLEALMATRPRLVAIGAASNALGTITDVARAARLAHEAGALIFVDAVHFAPHELVDVRALSCDFLACSAYKFYGPHLGILFAREELLQGLDVPKLAPAPDTAPERLETGTQNHEGIMGAAAAVDFLASLGLGKTRRDRLRNAFTGLHGRAQLLLRRLWNGLHAIDGVTLYGPSPASPRTPTVAFTVEGRSPDDVAQHLASRAVFVSSGDFYATTVVERLGLRQGLVRAGCACYTTEEEVDRLIEGVAGLSS
ncbi:MAG TPA: cysteine desulfurase-like protein [Gemmatimonadales bacterium]|jgi:cysteine desulfurase family protein (TIGR01976 family)|nr:cysteine desulfurase-like protein [Gemmatimonadales bacterium]